MDEAARFLRYVIPGLVSILSALLTILILWPSAMSGLLSIQGGESSFLAVALTVILGSGALGYIHANIYFAAFWFVDGLSFDHTDLLREVAPGLAAVDIDGKPVSVKTRREALDIASRFWAAQLKKEGGEDFQGLDHFVGTLVHHVHSLGAAAVGVLCSSFYSILALWYFFAHENTNSSECFWTKATQGISCLRWVFAILAWLLLQVVFWVARHIAKQKHDRITNSEIIEKIKGSKEPDKVFFIKKNDG